MRRISYAICEAASSDPRPSATTTPHARQPAQMPRPASNARRPPSTAEVRSTRAVSRHGDSGRMPAATQKASRAAVGVMAVSGMVAQACRMRPRTGAPNGIITAFCGRPPLDVLLALPATIYKAELDDSEGDRHYYGSHGLTVARHPSETDERMM